MKSSNYWNANIKFSENHTLFFQIETISTKQSVLGRLLSFGEIEFTGRGGISFKFIYVRNPTEVKRSFENSQ